MSITTVRGTAVDCHICKVTKVLPSGYEANAYAQFHSDSHRNGPGAVVSGPPVQQAPAPAAYPRYAKTSINHGRWLMLDLISCGLAIPFHIGAWMLGGRKTKFR